MTVVFDVLAQFSWFIWSFTSALTFVGCATISWHTWTRQARPYNVLLSAGLFLYGVALALVGMQAGNQPFVSPVGVLPWMRLTVACANVFTAVFFAIYWYRRITIMSSSMSGWIAFSQTRPPDGACVEVWFAGKQRTAVWNDNAWLIDGQEVAANEVAYYKRKKSDVTPSA